MRGVMQHAFLWTDSVEKGFEKFVTKGAHDLWRVQRHVSARNVLLRASASKTTLIVISANVTQAEMW